MIAPYQIAMIALNVAREQPSATADEIATALDFTVNMIYELDDEDQAAELYGDLRHMVDTVTNHIFDVMRDVTVAESVDTSWIDLAA